MYNSLMYSLANTLLQIPAMIILSVLAIGLSGYGISAYDATQFLPMLGLYTLTLWAFECVSELQAVQFTNPLIGMLNFMNIWFKYAFCITRASLALMGDGIRLEASSSSWLSCHAKAR